MYAPCRWRSASLNYRTRLQHPPDSRGPGLPQPPQRSAAGTAKHAQHPLSTRPARKFPAGDEGPPSCRCGSSPGRAIWWRRRRSGSCEPVPAPRLPAGGGRYCCFPPPPPPRPAALLCPAQRVGDGAGGPSLSALPMWVSRWGRERAGRCCCRWCCTHTPCVTSCPPPSWWARRPPTCWPGAPGACSPPSSPPASTARWTTACTPSTRAWCSSSSRTTRACRWAGGAARGFPTAAGGERREAALSPPRSPGARAAPAPGAAPGVRRKRAAAVCRWGLRPFPAHVNARRAEALGAPRRVVPVSRLSPSDAFRRVSVMCSFCRLKAEGTWHQSCAVSARLAAYLHAWTMRPALCIHGATSVVDKNVADYNCTSSIYITLLHLPTSVTVYLLSGLGLWFWISQGLWLFGTSESGARRFRLRRQSWQSVLPNQRVWVQVIMLRFTIFSSRVKWLWELYICLKFVKQIRRLLIQYWKNS